MIIILMKKHYWTFLVRFQQPLAKEIDLNLKISPKVSTTLTGNFLMTK